MIIRCVWLLLLVLITAVYIASAVRSVRLHWQITEARQTVKRLGDTTSRYFRGKEPPIGEVFWRSIGLSALKDPWGNPYLIEIPKNGVFTWRSYGPDGLRGTADDLIVVTLYSEEGHQDLSSEGTIDAAEPVNRSAK